MPSGPSDKGFYEGKDWGRSRSLGGKRGSGGTGPTALVARRLPPSGASLSSGPRPRGWEGASLESIPPPAFRFTQKNGRSRRPWRLVPLPSQNGGRGWGGARQQVSPPPLPPPTSSAARARLAPDTKEPLGLCLPPHAWDAPGGGLEALEPLPESNPSCLRDLKRGGAEELEAGLGPSLGLGAPEGRD